MFNIIIYDFLCQPHHLSKDVRHIMGETQKMGWIL